MTEWNDLIRAHRRRATVRACAWWLAAAALATAWTVGTACLCALAIRHLP